MSAEFLTMFKLGKDGQTVRQVVIHHELKKDLESIGFYDDAYKLAEAETVKQKTAELDKIEDAVIVEDKPKKKAPAKRKTQSKRLKSDAE